MKYKLLLLFWIIICNVYAQKNSTQSINKKSNKSLASAKSTPTEKYYDRIIRIDQENKARRRRLNAQRQNIVVTGTNQGSANNSNIEEGENNDLVIFSSQRSKSNKPKSQQKKGK